MIATYKVLSALLSYPQAELQEEADALIKALIAEGLVPHAQCSPLVHLIIGIARSDLLDAQSSYVDLFDRTRALSLHLFEHVHGESRDRGQAMVSLLDRYQEAGMDISANELPDYIPLFLEFLSLQTPEVARDLLAEPVHILSALGERLRKRGSTYAAVFDALTALSEAKADNLILSALRETEIENPDDLIALDKIWEETEVRFGPEDAKNASCPRAGDMLRKMDVPAKAAHSRGGIEA